MYTAIMTVTDLLLAFYSVIIPTAIFLYAGYKQRPRVLYILAYTAGVCGITYWMTSAPGPSAPM